jgi:hypothetical protein
MGTTPFPTRPSDVIALTVPEFTCQLGLNATVSFEIVCQRFLDDANRTLAWLIRFRALTAWRERDDVAAWLRSDPSHARHACEVAASFYLNDEWNSTSNLSMRRLKQRERDHCAQPPRPLERPDGAT